MPTAAGAGPEDCNRARASCGTWPVPWSASVTLLDPDRPRRAVDEDGAQGAMGSRPDQRVVRPGQMIHV